MRKEEGKSLKRREAEERRRGQGEGQEGEGKIVGLKHGRARRTVRRAVAATCSNTPVIRTTTSAASEAAASMALRVTQGNGVVGTAWAVAFYRPSRPRALFSCGFILVASQFGR